MHIDIHETTIHELGDRRRTIRVLLPEGYDQRPSRRYPVLYMQDGHNLFDPLSATYGAHWRIGETMDAMAAAGDGRRAIIVGVDCSHEREGLARLDEYSPWTNPDIGADLSRAPAGIPAGGEGEAYLSFLSDSLMPWVNESYRTLPGRESTGIAGSSLGGLFSLYALYRRPELFALCGAFSSAFWFAKGELLAFLASAFRPDRSVYLDIGTKETSDDSKPGFARRYLDDTLELRDWLLGRGQPGESLLCVVDEGADHSERSWARRFPLFIDWALSRLFGAAEGQETR